MMDLFCGTGGFASGVCQGLGPSSAVVFGIDSLEVATRTFRANHPGAAIVHGDIRKWPPRKVQEVHGIGPDTVDLIVGGPPCQGFSSIRPHRSAFDEDERNGLYQDFVEYVDFFRPPAFVMENVVGLVTHRGGTTLESIMRSFVQRGYQTDWRILNAANFGVPQRRERLIMIGLLHGADPPFPRPTHLSNGGTIGLSDKTRLITDQSTLYQTPPKTKAVTAWEAISDLPPVGAGEEAMEYMIPPKNEYQNRMRGATTRLTLHKATEHTARMVEIIKHSGSNINSLPPGMVTSGFSSSYSRLDPELPSVTLTVNFIHPASNKCIHPFEDRALTPREGARIQSFPDSFEFAGNRAQIVRQIGNAVPPLLGESLGRALAPFLR